MSSSGAGMYGGLATSVPHASVRAPSKKQLLCTWAVARGNVRWQASRASAGVLHAHAQLKLVGRNLHARLS